MVNTKQLLLLLGILAFTCVAEADQRALICLDRTTGQMLWTKIVLTSPLEKKHALNSYASSTPVTDGERIYVSFLDKKEMFIAAYVPSPIVVNGYYIVADDFGTVTCYQARTGELQWREKLARHYSASIVVDGDPGILHLGFTFELWSQEYNIIRLPA
ncbi:PQQ-binding-like beta-propeller repeat protein [Planctomycetota bacterium]